MAKCKFIFDFTDDIQDVLENFKPQIEMAGGIFTGDSNAGSISVSILKGKIKADYKIKNNKIELEIIKKPIFITCGMIESELKKYI